MRRIAALSEAKQQCVSLFLVPPLAAPRCRWCEPAFGGICILTCRARCFLELLFGLWPPRGTNLERKQLKEQRRWQPTKAAFETVAPYRNPSKIGLRIEAIGFPSFGLPLHIEIQDQNLHHFVLAHMSKALPSVKQQAPRVSCFAEAGRHQPALKNATTPTLLTRVWHSRLEWSGISQIYLRPTTQHVPEESAAAFP